MNKDLTSDIKLVERFMFDNSIYLLNMFEKKVDSFITTKTKKQKEKELAIIRQDNNRIDPVNFFDDPIKLLARDLTKPIWNCVVKVQPVVYCDKGSVFEDISTQQPRSMTRQLHSRTLLHFFHRFKTQHQDQSNLKINLIECDRNSNLSTSLNIDQAQILSSQRHFTRQLFILLMKCIERGNEFLINLADLGQIQENFKYYRSTLQAYSEVIMGYLEEEMVVESGVVQNRELDWFVKVFMHAIVSVLDSRAGATLITIQPHSGLINLLIHPALLSLHNTLCIQFKYNQKQKQQKDQQRHRHHNPQQKQKQKQLMQLQPSQQQQSINNETQQKSQFVFDELKYTNCSKVAFINLDGYEAEFNLDVVKYLARYVMYVAFPKEADNRLEANQLKEFERYKSERLLRKFFYQALNQEEKKELLNLHAIEEKDFKKNMFILPVHSKALAQKYELLVDSNGTELPGIQFYESTFVKFMMEEVVMPHLREYNPSMIIVSYSGKINIQNNYFIELIKQLTLISNFRLLLYVNQAKMFCFDEKGPQIVAGEDYFAEEQLYYEMYEKGRINMFSKVGQGNGGVASTNLDLLDKLSIFLKVSSGTYTLTKQPQQDSYIQKYKNYKIMRYSALLLKQISKQYPTIQKLKMRANQYLTISKVLKNSYINKSETFDKLFEKVVTRYHEGLIRVVEKLVFMDKGVVGGMGQGGMGLGLGISEDEAMVVGSCRELMEKINGRYQYIGKKEVWEDFRFQYRLQLSTQKTQSRFYLHIPKYRHGNTLPSPSKNLQQHIAAVQFQILDQKDKLSVQLTPNSSILYTKRRPYKEALVYVMNHIPKLKAGGYFCFCGVLNQVIDVKAEAKIQLRPIMFEKKRKMTQFQHYVDWNFFQTDNWVFLFWPRVWDDVADKLFRLLGEKYLPQATQDIFRASRSQPDKFYQLQIINPETYQYIIPRSGVTPYRPYQNNNRFFVFGGFYNSTENYLNFQTDVTMVDWSDDNLQCRVENVPKGFYLGLEEREEMEEAESREVFVKEFRNDFVRPRVEYEVFETEGQLEDGRKEVFLIGGVGEKFMRPYSLITYTATKLTFSPCSTLLTTRHIKTNNLLPANLPTATKPRSPTQLHIITNAQNRNIYLSQGTTTQQSLILTHYRYLYDPNQEKFDFEQVYEFADLEKKTYREDVQCLRKAPTDYPVKYQLVASSFRGKEFYNNFIKVSSQNGKRFIFELMLELSIQVKNTYPNYPKIVRLTGASILAIDINASMLCCLIRHPSYTLDKCILAHFDINDLSGKLIDSKSVQIHLKQIHKFDVDVSRNIIIVANSNTFAVLHGYRFGPIQIPQMILKKHKKNQIKTFSVRPSLQPSTILTPQLNAIHLVNQISSSFFINQSSGIILCLTFKSVERLKRGEHGVMEKVYLRIERLDMTKEEFRWRLLTQRFYMMKMGQRKSQQSILGYQQQGQQQGQIIHRSIIKLIQLKPNKQSKQRRQKQFTLKASYNQQIYTATLNLDNISQQLEFLPLNQSQEQYYKAIYKQSIRQESIYLEKNVCYYEEVKGLESLGNIEVEMDKMELEDNGGR